MDGMSNLGEGFWDSLSKTFVAGGDAAAKVISAYKGQPVGTTLTAEQQAILAQQLQAEQQAKTQKMLLIGGLAVGAIALLMYMRKK